VLDFDGVGNDLADVGLIELVMKKVAEDAGKVAV
jgi:hypothetical protein